MEERERERERERGNERERDGEREREEMREREMERDDIKKKASYKQTKFKLIQSKSIKSSPI